MRQGRDAQMAACKQTQSKFWKTECVLMGSRHKTKYADTQLQLESENEIVKKSKKYQRRKNHSKNST